MFARELRSEQRCSRILAQTKHLEEEQDEQREEGERQVENDEDVGDVREDRDEEEERIEEEIAREGGERDKQERAEEQRVERWGRSEKGERGEEEAEDQEREESRAKGENNKRKPRIQLAMHREKKLQPTGSKKQRWRGMRQQKRQEVEKEALHQKAAGSAPADVSRKPARAPQVMAS
jgi:hypothetical protein